MAVGEFMNVKDAAQALGCTDARIRQMLLAGTLQGKKATASVWLIPKKEVNRVAKQDRRRGGRPRIGD